jgi:hypothetical protein
MLLRKCSPVANQFCANNFFVLGSVSWVLAGSRLMPTGQCLIFAISFFREIVSAITSHFLTFCKGNRNLDSHIVAQKDAHCVSGSVFGTKCFYPDLSSHLFKQKFLIVPSFYQ